MNSICRTWRIPTFSQMQDIPAGESRTIDFNQLGEVPEDEFDIDEVKEEFKNLITEIASDVRLALELHLVQARSIM